jgi:L,D-peptidoglycan transpeptidase YkuD (ErfK/YbiS/YcfS/YnhG family)
MRQSPLKRLTVRPRPGRPSQGWLTAGSLRFPVALGRAGTKRNKREGDGATPAGRFHPLRLWWRADRHPRPATALPTRAIRADDAWCEDPRDRRYNRPIRRTDHNTRPRVARHGSAVFLHLARPGFAPTAGCVGLRPQAMRALLRRIDRRTQIVIG